MKPPAKRTNRFYDIRRFGQPQIRVYHHKARGKKTPSYLLKCGCCEEKLQVFYAEDGLAPHEARHKTCREAVGGFDKTSLRGGGRTLSWGLEIGGVNGAIEDWREILLPLLLVDREGNRFVDRLAKRRRARKATARRRG